MAFVRPQTIDKLTASEKRRLLQSYYAEYRQAAEQNSAILNQKLTRSAFADLLDRLGEFLLQEASALLSRPSVVRQFLEDNRLPPSLAGRLPDEFRVFCLALNALKQWVAAEQAATDRYLLGGTARKQCRAAAENCILSGVTITPTLVELHHPVRDGRPPIPVSKEAHAQLEGQRARHNEDTLRGKLLAIKRKSSRSWIML